ncbi:unnamed protein product [Penicillium pancosmium]
MKSGVVDQLTRRIAIANRKLSVSEYLEHKIYEDVYNPEGQSLPPLPAGPTHPRPVASENAASPALAGVLSMLAQEIQKLNSNIAPLFTAMVPRDDVSNSVQPQPAGVHRRRKRTRSDADSPVGRTALPDLPAEDVQDGRQKSTVNVLDGDNLEALVDAYFTNIARWIPMVHETTFRRKLQERAGSEPLPLVLHAMLVGALPILNATKQLLSMDALESEVTCARSKVILAASDGVSIEGLQALIIIAFTYLGNGEYMKAWPIIGSLTRSAGYLQLSVEEHEREVPTALMKLNLPPPSVDWIEEEERRRVFWNIFILDSCNISLTGENVWRRLPLCGTHWNTDTPATSPYFGIWDKSAAKIGNSIAFIPEHYPSPGQSTVVSNGFGDSHATSNRPGASPSAAIDMSTVGAFAYYIESLESLSRVNIYFLQQKCDFSNRYEVSSWLTRFKELDLRLVHWKMFLPAKWRDPNIPPAETGALDPNMTLAHVTHNTSMILLHQRIGYPELQLRSIKLPNFYSAETCRLAAVETATIAWKYLASSSRQMSLSPTFSFCLCISARVLLGGYLLRCLYVRAVDDFDLVHCQYYGHELDPNFWGLVEVLEEASRRWFSTDGRKVSLSGSFAAQLRQLYSQLQEDPMCQLDVLGTSERQPLGKSQSRPDFGDSLASRDGVLPVIHQTSISHNAGILQQPDLPSSRRHSPNTISPSDPVAIATHNRPKQGGSAENTSPAKDLEPEVSNQFDGIRGPANGDDLASLLETLGDQSFMDMDRVISYSDIDFAVNRTGSG